MHYSWDIQTLWPALEIGLLFFGTTSDLSDAWSLFLDVKCLFSFSENDFAKLDRWGFTENFDAMHAKAVQRSFQIFPMAGAWRPCGFEMVPSFDASTFTFIPELEQPNQTIYKAFLDFWEDLYFNKSESS